MKAIQHRATGPNEPTSSGHGGRHFFGPSPPRRSAQDGARQYRFIKRRQWG